MNQYQTVMEIMNRIEGVDLHEKKGGKFWFPLHMTRALSETSIEALELSQRSYNSLKRAELHTIGDIADAVSSGRELKSIRNCGAKSVREIMEHLFLYQYSSLPQNRQEAYLTEVILMNINKREALAGSLSAGRDLQG